MKALIVGAGPQGRVILDILKAQGRHTAFGFVDDASELRGREINGVRVECGLDEALREAAGIEMIVALGNPDLRQELAGRIASRGIPLLNAIHPSAVVMPSATLGRGIMVGANAVVNSNARIGDNVIINTAAVVEHDCVVGDGAALGPGAHLGGRAAIGPSAFIATRAIVLSRLSIGSRTVVGAGAVVTRDLPESVLAWGAPARVREKLEDFDWSRVL
jgi:sugar O-acyltransferase (sialic acid O-acetyltransferase NeuD family)